MTHQIHIIGGGLAGSEAAWQLAEAGIRVRLSEMRGVEGTPAHKTDDLAELVCSNSFRSDDAERNAVGLLHAEMRALGSLILRCADAHRVPAGSALAVDRDGFSAAVTARDRRPPADRAGARAGRCAARQAPRSSPPARSPPRRSPPRSPARPARTRSPSSMRSPRSSTATRIDMDIAWFQSRWNKGDGKDYINCALDQGSVSRLPRRPARRREDRVQGVGGEHPLFRRLHADRGDGRARRRYAALRPDEAGRARRSAHRPLALCRRPAAAGQCARHAVEHRRLPDQAEACRAGPPVPHHPRPARMPSSRGSAASTATPSSTRRACSMASCG